MTEFNFVAQKRCVFKKKTYNTNDRLSVVLDVSSLDEGLGQGGPWGYGGYTSAFIKKHLIEIL